jgi:hypothetical protein
MKLSVVLVLIAAIGSLAGPAAASTARCILKTADARYVGPCNFSPTAAARSTLRP